MRTLVQLSLVEQYKRNEEKERLKAIIHEVVAPDEFNPSIIDLNFEAGAVIFTLDSVFSDDWFDTLRNGSYGHSWVLGYDTNNLRKKDKNKISMTIRGSESRDTVKSIVENVKSWVRDASREYSQAAKQHAIAEQRRREEARMAEIRRIEKETEMSSTINSLLKELL